MSAPQVLPPKPYLVVLEEDRKYFWCACGRSKKQPFCDGSHAGTGIEPQRFVAMRTEEVLLCGCKHTREPPFCDGAHNGLPGGCPHDDPDSPANRAIAWVTDSDGPRRWLDGGCHVICADLVEHERRGSLRHCRIVGPEFGAAHQAQFLLEAEGEITPALSVGASDAILFVTCGSGEVVICGRRSPVKATDGVYLRSGEVLQLAPHSGETLKMFLLASPPAELEWPTRVPENFDDNYPQRVVAVDAAQRVAMGPRYFQLLVDKRIGSQMVTQFIGHIPQSKAAPHRHLYEETLIVLAGRGCMWTETRRTPVGPGEVIFLPRKQLHSLQATDSDGLFVVGVICPGDNPSINYYD